MYELRSFNSATGHTFWQVFSPLGNKVYETTERAKAESRRDELNERLAKELAA